MPGATATGRSVQQTRCDSDGPLISVRQVTKRFGGKAVLDQLDLDIPSGVTALVGPNGSGKTTLIRLVLGLIAPDAGEIRVMGEDPTRSGPWVRRRVGHAADHQRFPAGVDASTWVAHVAELHGIPRRVAEVRAADALWFVRLGEERHRSVRSLSVGQRQRVKVAAALAHDPQVVILDEPTEGLDPSARRSVLELLLAAHDELGTDVLLATHVVDDLRSELTAVIDLGEAPRVRAVDVRSVDIRTPRRGASFDERAEGGGETDAAMAVVVRVGVVGDPQPLRARLSRLGLTVGGAAQELIIQVGGRSADVVTDAIRDALADLGIGLLSLRVGPEQPLSTEAEASTQITLRPATFQPITLPIIAARPDGSPVSP